MNSLRVPAFAILAGILFISVGAAQTEDEVKATYVKYEFRVPMRDGVRLFTAVYIPRDSSQQYPMLLNRTPYSVGPYGLDRYWTVLGPSPLFQKSGYIFVHQDVRGRFMSEGEFTMMTPYRPNKKTADEVDDASDTYDTIDWLLKNVRGNNGRVGVWGISFPGYYAAMSTIDAHPALKAVSPQAPMADVFIGDDFHHNGAFFLPHAFGFLNVFRRERAGLQSAWKPGLTKVPTPDGYRFFLDLGPVSNANARYFHDSSSLWNEMMQHGTYDAYWKARNVPQHLKDVRPAVMTVGGLFDSEDLYGPFAIYRAIEQNSPQATNTLVIGPWVHGGWARLDGDTLGLVRFGEKTSVFYRERIEFPFFERYLKDMPAATLPEALVYMTGTNQWRSYDEWPPKAAQRRDLYFRADGQLSFEPARVNTAAYDEYVSDPKKPVPFTSHTTTSMGQVFMVEDQRLVGTRPDVISYESDILPQDLAVVGPIRADLQVSTSGTDCDFIVKVIDVYPDTTSDDRVLPWGMHLGGMQQLVRYEVMRAKFRKSLENPEPMPADMPTNVAFELRDVSHMFRKGHRIMVQVHSTWFPLIDLNPGIFTDIYRASASDFRPTVQRMYRSASLPSRLTVNVLP
jgi:hypothetical protein